MCIGIRYSSHNTDFLSIPYRVIFIIYARKRDIPSDDTNRVTLILEKANKYLFQDYRRYMKRH